MDKTLVLIVGAAVMLATGLMVAYMTTSSIGGFSKTTSSMEKENVCSFQQKNTEPGKWNDKCLTESVSEERRESVQDEFIQRNVPVVD